MKRSLIATLIGMIAIGVTGCGSLDSKVQGKWTQESESNNIFANMALQNSPKATLELKSDHRFVLALAAVRKDPKRLGSALINQGGTIEGTWKIADEQIQFTPETFAGKPIDQVKKEIEDQVQAEIQPFESSANALNPQGNADPQSPQTQVGQADMQAAPSQQGSKPSALDDLKQMAIKELRQAIPIPVTGKLSEKGGSIKVQLEGGVTMSFGKEIGANA